MADYRYFPHDILVTILKHLPSKTLIRFLCVSKSFYSIITNPTFISSHLHVQKQNHKRHLFIVQGDKHFSVCRYGNNLAYRTALVTPLTPTGSLLDSIKIAESHVNGVVCLYNRNEHARSLCLWNPFIHKHLIVDPIPNLYPCNSYGSISHHDLVLGLGFESISNDYKVVAIAYCHRLESPKAQFYSLSCKTWKKVELFPGSQSRTIFCLFEGCFVKGVIHWMMFHGRWSDDYDFAASILTFDVYGEVFGELELPVGLGRVEASYMGYLAVINGSLAMLHCHPGQPHDNCVDVVWQMKEEFWTVLYRIKIANYISWFVCGDYGEGQSVIETGIGSLIVFDEENASPTNVVDGKRVVLPG